MLGLGGISDIFSAISIIILNLEMSFVGSFIPATRLSNPTTTPAYKWCRSCHAAVVIRVTMISAS